MTIRQNPVNFPYRLGLPAWAFAGWRDRYFHTRPSLLTSYSMVFNCVEGNTTFYGIPDEHTVQQWVHDLEGRACKIYFKLPKTVTHQAQFSKSDLILFVERLSPLKSNCGEFLLQFPAWADVNHLQKLEFVYDTLAQHGGATVEVRHPDFFSNPDRLESLLEQYGFGRVVLDARAIHLGKRDHPEVLAALHAKPDLPVLSHVYNGKPFVRLVLHPDLHSNSSWLSHWAHKVWHWIEGGLTPVMMIHCPNNLHCPELARQFHDCLRRCSGNVIDELPGWPVPQQAQLW